MNCLMADHIVWKIALSRTRRFKVCGTVFQPIKLRYSYSNPIRNRAADSEPSVHDNAIFKTMSSFSLVFRMVEAEEEYVEQLEILISCFLRPFKMAASSKNPPCSHEDINSIFLNSETVLFLHQIFLKGLTARMDSWPTLVLGTSLGAISFPETVF